MDDSKTYINMCEKAEEIQQSRIPRVTPYSPIPYCNFQLGDWTNLGVITDVSIANANAIRDKAVWIPRQDQLQKMIKSDDGASDYGKLTRFWMFIKNNPGLQSNHWTMEQLWLIYVMRWEYHKVWNGTDWEAST